MGALDPMICVILEMWIRGVAISPINEKIELRLKDLPLLDELEELVTAVRVARQCSENWKAP